MKKKKHKRKLLTTFKNYYIMNQIWLGSKHLCFIEGTIQADAEVNDKNNANPHTKNVPVLRYKCVTYHIWNTTLCSSVTGMAGDKQTDGKLDSGNNYGRWKWQRNETEMVQLCRLSVTCHSGSTCGFLCSCMRCCYLFVTWLEDACTTVCDVCYLSQWLNLWMPVNCMWCLLPVTVARLVDACTTACDVCYLSQWLDLWMSVQLLFSSTMVLCSSELTESSHEPSASSLMPSILPTMTLQIVCTRFSSEPPNDWHEQCL
jgi:hypothetical protein